MDQKDRARQAAHDRVIAARERLVTAQAESAAMRRNSTDLFTVDYHVANVAWLNAAEELSSALLAYSDILMRP